MERVGLLEEQEQQGVREGVGEEGGEELAIIIRPMCCVMGGREGGRGGRLWSGCIREQL